MGKKSPLSSLSFPSIVLKRMPSGSSLSSSLSSSCIQNTSSWSHRTRTGARISHSRFGTLSTSGKKYSSSSFRRRRLKKKMMIFYTTARRRFLRSPRWTISLPKSSPRWTTTARDTLQSSSLFLFNVYYNACDLSEDDVFLFFCSFVSFLPQNQSSFSL